MPELTGLIWKLDFTQKVADAEAVQKIEQEVLHRFASQRLLSNGEILRDVDATSVRLAIIKAFGSF